jgi:hypothetical protein
MNDRVPPGQFQEQSSIRRELEAGIMAAIEWRQSHVQEIVQIFAEPGAPPRPDRTLRQMNREILELTTSSNQLREKPNDRRVLADAAKRLNGCRAGQLQATERTNRLFSATGSRALALSIESDPVAAIQDQIDRRTELKKSPMPQSRRDRLDVEVDMLEKVKGNFQAARMENENGAMESVQTSWLHARQDLAGHTAAIAPAAAPAGSAADRQRSRSGSVTRESSQQKEATSSRSGESKAPETKNKKKSKKG